MGTLSTCLQLSESAYTGMIPDGFDDCVRIWASHTHTLGYAYITPDTVWIAMRGTVNKWHWLSNLRILKTDYYGIRSHRGFSESARSVLEQVRSVLDDHEGKRIVFTGHSMGGAVATLLAVACRSTPVELITFGQPCVSTSDELDRTIRGHYVRIVNGSDIVPRKPIFGYSHSGELIYLSNEGGRLTNPGWFARLRDRLFMAWVGERLTDHSTTDYKREMELCGIS